MTIRLAIVDDHPLVTGGLKAALATIDGIDVVAHGGSVAEARDLLGRDDLDVVLLDVRLQDGNSIQALAERGARERPAVLVISSFETRQYVAAAARYGAAGFLLKTVPLPALVDGIRTVADGGSVFTRDQLQKGMVKLSPRERQIVRLAMDGLGNKEIATRINASPKTVESHLTAIFERFGINGGRIELAFRAADEGWLDIEPPDAVAAGSPGSAPRA
jgi:two-component system, NarL family, nitrate/nitrite response regulator NarL